jgi:hypothetical protein
MYGGIVFGENGTRHWIDGFQSNSVTIAKSITPLLAPGPKVIPGKGIPSTNDAT